MPYKPNITNNKCNDCGGNAKTGQYGLYCVTCWKADKEGKPKFGSKKLTEPTTPSEQFVLKEPVDWDAIREEKTANINHLNARTAAVEVAIHNAKVASEPVTEEAIKLWVGRIEKL